MGDTPIPTPRNERRERKLEDLQTHQGELESFLRQWCEQQDVIIKELQLDLGVIARGVDENECSNGCNSFCISHGIDAKSRVSFPGDRESAGERELQSRVASLRYPTHMDSLKSSEAFDTLPGDSKHSSLTQSSELPHRQTIPDRIPEQSFGSVHSLYEQLKNRFHSTASATTVKTSTTSTRAFGSMSSMVFFPKPPKRDEAGKCFSRLRPIFRSGAFESFNCFVIFGHVIFLGMSADYSINAHEHLAFADTAEWAFCAYYMLEILLRIYGYGPRIYFCTRSNWGWNFLDWGLIALLIYERITSIIALREGSTYNGQSLVSFRSVRLIKCVQCFRFIRIVQTFRELRMIANTIAGSFKPLLWSFALMLVVTFMFGTCLLQATASYLEDVEPKDARELRKHWGSLSQAMLSLYAGMRRERPTNDLDSGVTGGEDWMVLAAPLKNVGTAFYVLFVIYIFLYLFVIVNTVTSLFVASTLADADKDDLQIMLGELERKDRYIKTFSKWFMKLDKDFSGDVSLQEFKQFMKEPDFLNFAARLGIDVFDMRQFFYLISSGGAERVDIERFVVWCIKLRGNAKAIDLLDLSYWHKESVAQLKSVALACKRDFDVIGLRLKALQDDLKTVQEHLESKMVQDSETPSCEQLNSAPPSARSERKLHL